MRLWIGMFAGPFALFIAGSGACVVMLWVVSRDGAGFFVGCGGTTAMPGVEVLSAFPASEPAA